MMSRNVIVPATMVAICLSLAGMRAPAAADDAWNKETTAERDARMQWWRDARFGMFIHWGLYAIPAGRWNGQPVDGIGEWIMDRANVPIAEYEKLAPQFNPVKYDPAEWVRIVLDRIVHRDHVEAPRRLLPVRH
jgi:alpha-L-fucosidase